MNMIRSTTKYLYDNEMDLTNNVNNYKFIDNDTIIVFIIVSIFDLFLNSLNLLFIVFTFL